MEKSYKMQQRPMMTCGLATVGPAAWIILFNPKKSAENMKMMAGAI